MKKIIFDELRNRFYVQKARNKKGSKTKGD